MKKTFLQLFLLGATLFSAAQPPGNVLKIGDRVPDIQFNQILNHPTGQAMLSEFKKPLVLIEFWSIYCGSCIAGMPKLQKLQEAFADEVQILMVTDNSMEQILKLRERNELVRNCTLPMVVGDSALTSLFRYQTVPAFAWINREGKLTHFTDRGRYLNKEGFRQYLDGVDLDMPLKVEYGDFNPEESLLTEGQGRNIPRIKYYSLISGKIDYDQSRRDVIRDLAGNRIGVYYLNRSMLDLYLSAYGSDLRTTELGLFENRVLIEDSSPDRYYARKAEDYYRWKQDNTYCYEARVPPGKYHLINGMLKRDLDNFFDFTVSIEPRQQRCLVLSVLDEEKFISMTKTKGGIQDKRLSKKVLFQHNFSFSTFLSSLHSQFSLRKERVPTLVLNETELSDFQMDIDLKGDLTDNAVLKRELNRYGLDLSWENRELPMLVLRKRTGGAE